jgi:hypothetical protein
LLVVGVGGWLLVVGVGAWLVVGEFCWDWVVVGVS